MSRLARGLVAAALATMVPATATAQAAAYEQMQLLSGVLSHVRLNYVDSVDLSRMIRASIRGILSDLDPHSHYMTRQEFDLRMRWDRGELASPGMRLHYTDGAVMVTTVAPASPAARAGIQPGDRVVRLDEMVTSGLDAQATEMALLGDKGTKVRITLERGNRLLPDTFSVTLKRIPLEHRVVDMTRLVGPETGYVRLSEFTPTAPEELAKAIGKLQGSGARRMILDLRGNGGGDMDAMTAIASAFLPEGQVIYRTQGRKRMGPEAVVSNQRGRFAELPLVLLIDAGSASASEILAGTLQDHDRALAVGRRSFGKALMQSSLPLANGDVVWLTVARVMTPSGRIIQRSYAGAEGSGYFERAGGTGAGEDTVRVFRTKGGRLVRGGGGILPDVVSPGPPDLPAWFTLAAAEGYDVAVADSVAGALSADTGGRRTWLSDSAGWESRLVGPFLERVRANLGVQPAPDVALRIRLGQLLAARAAFTRWGSDAEEEFVVRNDRDIQLALAQFDRLKELLSAGGVH